MLSMEDIQLQNKRCSKCGFTGPLDAFQKNRRGKHGRGSWCRQCCAKAASRYRLDNLDRERENNRKWRANNLARARATVNRRQNKSKSQMSRKNSMLRLRYGITLDQFNQMLIAQNNKCAICQILIDETPKKQLCVDHCHTTEKIRGLLCGNCNAGIGSLKDSIQLLESAISYLKETS